MAGGAASIEPKDAPDLRDKAKGRAEQPPPPGPDEAPPLLHPDCPVQPLGRLGTASYYLDEMGQMVRMGTKDWNDVGILTLFGRRYAWLETPGRGWPRYGKPVENKATGEKEFPIVGFDYALAKKALLSGASLKGIFDPQGRVRGPGAHRGDDGELILHCGDTVMVGGMVRVNGEQLPEIWHEPGLHDGHVYPTAPALPRPAVDPSGDQAGREILRVLKTWAWRRKLVDPILMLGQIAALPVAGALAWRPHSWVTGGRGTGKSSLLGKQGLVPMMFDKALIVTADATEAGLRQMTSQKTIPILFEELEPDWTNPRAKAVIELARKASSGADIYRGGSDHNAASFKAETSFIFSSILIPPMPSQDKSRMAFLELDPLAADAVPLKLDRREWASIGRAMTRRMVDQWHRFEETLQLYRNALADHGHDARGQDQFGTLLACHDLLLYDAADYDDEDNRFLAFASMLDAKRLAESIGGKSDDLEVLEQLSTVFLHSRGGDDRETVGQVIIKALDKSTDGGDRRARARERLQSVGLRLGVLKDKGDGTFGFREDLELGTEPIVLAIAGVGNVGLRELFRQTRWYEGGWTQSLGRVPGAQARVRVRFAGRGDWAVCVPIEHVVQLGDEEGSE